VPCSVTRNPSPRPAAGDDLLVTAIIQGAATDVTLSYLVGYGPIEEIPMTSGPGGQSCDSTIRWWGWCVCVECMHCRVTDYSPHYSTNYSPHYSTNYFEGNWGHPSGARAGGAGGLSS